MKRATKLFLLILFFIFVNGLLYSQQENRYVKLFDVTATTQRNVNNFVENPLMLKIDNNMLDDVFMDSKDMINLEIPVSKDLVLKLNLFKFQVFADDFIIRTSSGDTLNNYKKGVFYRGRLNENDGFASISIFQDHMSGIVSVKGIGNFNLGKLENSKDYIIYNDQKVKVDMGIACYTEDDYDNMEEQNRKIRQSETIVSRVNCVKFYLEGDYALYQNKGSISATADYMTELFSQMATLYDNENISIEIKEMKIWDSQDNYSVSSSSAALDQFELNNPDMDADLGLLFALGGNNTGGLAWIDVLCNNSNRFAYSNIDDYYNNVPTYSWSVEVITHETGHNLGSRHTHACVWNGDNTQIDDCGNEYYYNNGTPYTDIEGYPCYDTLNPILPTSGTIMSYCHLIAGIGIDFNNGFGQQPGDLIRSNVNNASCLTSCEASSTCDIPVNVKNGTIGSTTADLEWVTGASGSTWEVEYGITGFTLGGGTQINNITTEGYTLTGLNIDDTYDWYVRTDCGGGDYSNWVGPKTFSTVCVAPATISLPYIQDWESDSGTRTTTGLIRCGLYDEWDFETDVEGVGRVRWGTDCPSSMVPTGSGALVMDRNQSSTYTINYSILTLDISDNANSDELYLDFNLFDAGDETQSNDKIWMRGDTTDSWLVAYDISPAGLPNGTVIPIRIDIDSVLNTGNQTPGPGFQIRFGEEDNFPTPSDGLSFDDIKVSDCRLNLPFSDDFSTQKDCWVVEDVNNDGYKWEINSSGPCDQSEYGLVYEGATNPSISMDDWLFTPGVYLLGGFTYEVSFLVGDLGFTEKMEVFLSQDNSSSEALNNGVLLFKDEGIDNGGCYKSAIEFTPSVTGTFFIGFHGYSDANSYHKLYIDDFNIKDAPGLSASTIEDNTNNTCDQYIVNGVAGNVWHNIYNENNLIASINPNGQTLGGVYVDMRDGGAVETYSINNQNAKTIPRYFNFESDNILTVDASIKLYFLQDELDEYNNTPPVTNDVVGDLQINHYDGVLENCDFSDNADNGVVINNSNIVSGNSGSSNIFMQFDVSSFSEMLIHQHASTTTQLRYDLFAQPKKDYNLITFVAYNEVDLDKYILEKKIGSDKWEEMEEIKSENKDYNEYEFVDYSMSYSVLYRIKIIDLEGRVSKSNIVEVRRDEFQFALRKIFPNPTKGNITLKMILDNNKDLEITIKDILSREVFNDKISSKNNYLIHSLDISDLKNGIYFIALKQGNKKIIKKIVKQQF